MLLEPSKIYLKNELDLKPPLKSVLLIHFHAFNLLVHYLLAALLPLPRPHLAFCASQS